MEKTETDDTVNNYTDYVLRYFPKDALRLLEDRTDPFHQFGHANDAEVHEGHEGHEGHEVPSSLLRRLAASHKS